MTEGFWGTSASGAQTWHPLVDFVGAGFVGMSTDSDLVWLSPARADLLLGAIHHGVAVILESGPRTRLTEPMREALTEAGGLWVVRSADGTRFDALTGRQLPRPGGPVVADGEDQARASAWLVGDSASLTVQLIISWSVRLKAEQDTLLGGSVETFLTALGLPLPIGWGPHEPVTEPWFRPALTGYVRDRMPQPSRVIVLGEGSSVALTMTVQRTSHGVEEMVTGLVALESTTVADDALTARLVAALKALADGTMPLFAFAMARMGRSDLTASAHIPGLPLPVAMLIGPPGVRQLGIDVPSQVQRWQAVAVGRARLPGLVYPLMPTSESDTHRLADILGDMDPALLASVLPSDIRAVGQ